MTLRSRGFFYRLFRLVHLLYYTGRYLQEHGQECAPDNRASDDGFDIVVPVCLRDVGLLRLQARSINKFLDPSFDGHIYVILNDWRYYLLRRRISKWLPAEYGQHSKKVIFCPFYCLGFQMRGYSGWIMQQICKLAISRHVTSSHYLVLDAKNQFVKPCGRRDFISPSGKALQTLDPWVPSDEPISEYFHESFSYFDLDPALLMVPQPITPFVLATNVVRQLITYIEEREHTSLSAFLTKRRRVAEFILYVAYLYQQYGNLGTFIDHAPDRSVTIWEAAAENSHCIEEHIERTNQENVLMFGAHPQLVQKLSASQLRKLEEFWRGLGIITAGESIFEFCPEANGLGMPGDLSPPAS
jgi:hypothetical protein